MTDLKGGWWRMEAVNFVLEMIQVGFEKVWNWLKVLLLKDEFRILEAWGLKKMEVLLKADYTEL